MGDVYPLRIPLIDVVRWAELNEIDKPATRFLDRCVQAMEDEYMQWWNSPVAKNARETRRADHAARTSS